MPVKPNDRTVVDGNRNVSAPTEPEEPDCRLHDAWSAKYPRRPTDRSLRKLRSQIESAQALQRIPWPRAIASLDKKPALCRCRALASSPWP